MQFAMSNIAWRFDERLSAYALMTDAGMTGLEIAPGLFFAQAEDPFAPDAQTAKTALAELEAHNLTLVSMQSLLFGVDGAELFGDTEALARFEAGMNRAIDLAERFGIPNLVMGSPKQRIVPDNMSQAEAMAHAQDVFRRLGDRAVAAGTAIAMETNPADYGTNFLTHLHDTTSFVTSTDHPGVVLILDLGAMHMNNSFDSTPDALPDLVSTLNHVHISEPYLAPAPADALVLAPVLRSLNRSGYTKSGFHRDEARG